MLIFFYPVFHTAIGQRDGYIWFKKGQRGKKFGNRWRLRIIGNDL